MGPNEWVPLRWSSGPVEALKGSPVNCLVVPEPRPSDTLIQTATALGLTVVSQGSLPFDVALREESEWPSVSVGRDGNAEAGPTGYPWVDANGWRCQLAAARFPGKTVWTSGEPKGTGVRPEMYALAVADASTCGTFVRP